MATELIPQSARKSKFDHASTLPHKRTITDPDCCSMYFLAGAGLIKIGISTNPTERILAIRNSSPVPLELLATMPGATFEECRMHSRFRHLRRHGEWFEDDGSIRELILKLAAQPMRKVVIPEGCSLLQPPA